jgi:peptidoglycan hydrolase-like protein with peptidoglycan-binding domain
VTQTIFSQQQQVVSNGDVANLQQWLAQQGLYHGPIDGKYSDEFSGALGHWQKSQGLVSTGTVDFATLAHVHEQVSALSGHGNGTLDPKVRQMVVDHYGAGMAAYLNTELGPIIIDAAKAGNTTDILYGKLSQTQYWQNTQQSAKNWDQLKVTDPASARSKLDGARLMVQQQAQSLGLTLTSAQLNQLSDDAVRYDWIAPGNRGLMTNIMVNTIKTNPALMQSGGGYASALDQVKATAANYLVKVDDKGASDMAAKLVQGVIQDKDVADYYGRLAKARHPGLAHVIDAGTDLKTFLDPYRQDIAKEMDLSPDAVDFINDPRWSKLLDYNPDGKGPRMATTAEALEVARSQPEWWNTTNGKAAGASLGLSLARGMGIQT